jgi:hypothetical protein
VTRTSGSRSPRRHLALDALALAALAGAACLFWEVNVLRAGVTEFALSNFDLFSEFYPRHSFAGEAIRRGMLPLWDPHQIGGLPFFATLQGGVLYPPNLLYAVLPTGFAMGALGLFHLILAGVFSFLLSREFGYGRTASWLAGLTFMLGGSTVFLIYHTNAINSCPWLPAALWCTSRLGRSGEMRWALLLGICLALQFLAGRDYTLVMTIHIVGLFSIFQLVWMRRDGLGWRRLGKHAIQLAVAGLLAVGLAAAQLLPTLALAAESGRTLTGLKGEFLEIYGPMPPSLFFANLIHPDRGPLRREYFGWIPLACCLLSFRLWGRDRPAVFASLVAGLSLVLCFGSQTPLYAAYRAIPLGAVFRLPDRFVFALSIAVAMLAAGGFERVFRTRVAPHAHLRSLAPRFALLLGVGIALLVVLHTGWLAAELGQTAQPWGWFTFYGIGLEHFASIGRSVAYCVGAISLLATAAWRGGGRGTALLKLAIPFLAAVDLCYALESRSLHPARDSSPALAAASCYEMVPRFGGELGRHLSFRLPFSYALKDKDGELFARYSASHYDPLVTHRQTAFFEALQEGGTPITVSPWSRRSSFMGFLSRFPAPERTKLLDLMGVVVVLVDGEAPRRAPALAALLSRFERAGRCRASAPQGPAAVDLYVNPNALERAFVVHNWMTVLNTEQAIRKLVASDFDLRREAVVEAALPTPDSVGPRKASEVSILEYRPTRVVVRARIDRPGLLVLTDTYDRDWSALRSGMSVPIHLTDGLFRGVLLPAGESEVIFYYRPRTLYWGAAISVLAFIAWVLLWRSGASSGKGVQRPHAG